jgi:hypothetical protein
MTQDIRDLENGFYAPTVVSVDSRGQPVVSMERVSLDAGGRQRTSSLTTLFDGKALTTDDTNLWDTQGTGTGTMVNNKFNMAVTAGQYLVRAGKFYCPYFSGKSQLVEVTIDNFQSQTGLTKRVGYFSSNAVSPYDTTKDGFWLESSPSGISFVVQNAGTQVVNTPLSSWDNYSSLSNYNWSNFTVVEFDFLWLGGTSVRTIMHINGVFELVHTFEFSGNFTGTFIKSPNQTVRYEIRSTTGVGYLSAICSQVATEGSASESGKSLAVINDTAIACNTVGTIYALKSIKKNPTYRDNQIEVLNFGCLPLATADAGIMLMILNPTVSAPITYANTSRLQVGTPTTQTVTAGTGRILYAIPVGQFGSSQNLTNNFLSSLGISLNNTPDEVVFCYMPTTSNQSIHSTINLKEY